MKGNQQTTTTTGKKFLKDVLHYNGYAGDQNRQLLLENFQNINELPIIASMIASSQNGDDYADAFCQAVSHNHMDLFKLFLEHGIDVNIKDNSGRTALMIAISENHSLCIQCLLFNYNANVDICSDYDSMTALHRLI